MTKTSIRPIRYINDFVEAPKSAEYIIRIMYESSRIYFEMYQGNYCNLIKEFNIADMYEKKDFQNILRECRKLMGNNKTIWCEKPGYMILE